LTISQPAEAGHNLAQEFESFASKIGHLDRQAVLVSDPVGEGFVAGLPRPGGNITGFVHTEGEFVGNALMRAWPSGRGRFGSRCILMNAERNLLGTSNVVASLSIGFRRRASAACHIASMSASAGCGHAVA
jgi:hypothetical protein